MKRFRKKRYIVTLFLIFLIMITAGWLLPQPVQPFIQLPGEKYPYLTLPVIGGLTNTFVASLVAYGLLIALALGLRARSRTADEIPNGFYNFVEMLVEVTYNFAERIAHEKTRDFYPYFATILFFLLIANWMALVPGMDSIGIWEHKPHFFAEQDAAAAGLEKGTPEYEAFVHDLEDTYETLNVGDLRIGPFLLRAEQFADDSVALAQNAKGENIGRNPDAADWTIVPFLRPAATDINLNLALAIFAMIMVQFYGFKYLGASYLHKFFNFQIYWVDTFAQNPLQGLIKGLINPIVGLIELVSEIAKIVSFTFRLLGAIFGGMVLLFVMSSIAAIANVAFFGLELFVGGIQAIVFGLLTLIFMNSATHSHVEGEDHH
jgi:F-type H+-transporting ATPase subunit a